MLIVKDFKWSQTQDEIHIRVPLKNISKDNVDIVTHENFIKIHASPYYFEAFLLHNINEDRSLCQLMSDEARFILLKANAIKWDTLERSFINKEEKIKLKNEILAQVQTKEQEKFRVKQQTKAEIKKVEVENAITKDAEVSNLVTKDFLHFTYLFALTDQRKN